MMTRILNKNFLIQNKKTGLINRYKTTPLKYIFYKTNYPKIYFNGLAYAVVLIHLFRENWIRYLRIIAIKYLGHAINVLMLLSYDTLPCGVLKVMSY